MFRCLLPNRVPASISLCAKLLQCVLCCCRIWCMTVCSCCQHHVVTSLRRDTYQCVGWLSHFSVHAHRCQVRCFTHAIAFYLSPSFCLAILTKWHDFAFFIPLSLCHSRDGRNLVFVVLVRHCFCGPLETLLWLVEVFWMQASSLQRRKLGCVFVFFYAKFQPRKKWATQYQRK